MAKTPKSPQQNWIQNRPPRKVPKTTKIKIKNLRLDYPYSTLKLMQ
jgi:hypothetical protein